jgi:hypothetical protein
MVDEPYRPIDLRCFLWLFACERVHALPSHCLAAGDRVVVEITGQKLGGVLVLPVSLMYQKMTTPSLTTKTQPLIAALEK